MFISVIFVAILPVCHGLFVDQSDPYSPGPLNVSVLEFSPALMPINTPPIRTRVYFPMQQDAYATYYYLAGLVGTLPAAFYDYVNTYVASHGYIVFQPWPVRGDNGTAFTAEEHVANIKWLEENVNEHMNGTSASFEHFSIGCHSSGCGMTLKLALNQSHTVKSLINFEPVHGEILEEQPGFYLPTFMMGAELSNMSCSMPGIDFETWYSLMDCPRIMTEVADVGHCDFLDDLPYNGCRELGACPIGEESLRNQYQDTVGGFASAFMTAYVQGNMEQLEYITNEDLIPLALLQHEVDTDC